jgi:hypothetical protein
VALTAADRTGKALLFGGLMMLLSLGAGLLGGALGVQRRPTREDTPLSPSTDDAYVPPATTPRTVTTTTRDT